ncbi:MAG: hypothetical protein J6D29_02025 [Solobacterium sp.]|nr:hypothetical protein [Solobacterium sp.]
MVVLENLIPVLVVLFMIIMTIAGTSKKKPQKKVNISSDGHVVKPSEDLTCETQYGHEHETNVNDYGRRYIVHEEPEEGYVVLNGIKRKLEDCAKL